MEKETHGTLYIVGTPIGNLKDITLRAIETLKNVDLIAAEDTRHTRKLTSHYNIKTPLISYFEHNKVTRGSYLIKLLRDGKDVALVSDSGTPGISDPGYYIIKLAIENDISLTALPGPTALVVGLVLSGMVSSRFIFEGFLSSKRSQRKNRLREFVREERPVVIYESPHRLVKMLEDVLEVLGDRRIACARELTKKFEEVRRGRVSEIIGHFTKTIPKGEFVIAIGPD